jgi:heme A synthase
MNFLYQAHSGLRYLVLLAGLAALVTLAIAFSTNRPSGAAKGLTSAFVGLLDLQVLLGIALVISGVYYGALMGHLAMMVLAVVAAHGSSVLAKRTPDARKATQMRLMGVVAALLLIVFGILAIGRSVIGSGPMTTVG